MHPLQCHTNAALEQSARKIHCRSTACFLIRCEGQRPQCSADSQEAQPPSQQRKRIGQEGRIADDGRCGLSYQAHSSDMINVSVFKSEQAANKYRRMMDWPAGTPFPASYPALAVWYWHEYETVFVRYLYGTDIEITQLIS